MASVEVPLSQGLVALIDESDAARVLGAGKWHASDNGCGNVYAARWFGRKKVRLHVFLTGWPITDHINGDGLDNRRSNLRPATHAQNASNNPGHGARSGLKGVTAHPQGRWKAQITYQRRNRYLGIFATPEEAARAYDEAALAFFGEFARPNFQQ